MLNPTATTPLARVRLLEAVEDQDRVRQQRLRARPAGARRVAAVVERRDLAAGEEPVQVSATASAFQAFRRSPAASARARPAPSPVAAGIRTPTRTSPSGVLASRRCAEAGSGPARPGERRREQEPGLGEVHRRDAAA
jgi:hypothetical protein